MCEFQKKKKRLLCEMAELIATPHKKGIFCLSARFSAFIYLPPATCSPLAPPAAYRGIPGGQPRTFLGTICLSTAPGPPSPSPHRTHPHRGALCANDHYLINRWRSPERAALADFELDLLSFAVMQDQINDKYFESLQRPFRTAAQASPLLCSRFLT